MQKKILWLLFLGGMNVHPLYAGMYPMVTNVTVEILAPHLTDYHFTQTLVEIGSSTDQLPNRSNICLGHRHLNLLSDAELVSCTVDSVIRKGETIGQAAIRLYEEQGSKITTVTHNGRKNKTECIGYFAHNGSMGSWDTAVFPAGTCIFVSPGDDWCKLTSPTLVLDHGTISLKEAEGHSAEDSLGVQCTTGTTVQLKLVGVPDYIPLTQNGKAYITIDGKAPGSLFALPAGNSTLTVADKLSNVSKGGIYYGMSILIMEPF
ncbi:hypothetical protein FCH33_07320 [Serratia fonticola]|uniref:hypothetical protein n=1 Tax=Serratia fonticola TaxID=47917 RepID=UPI00157694C9|nr:hypothetical protein [Serratia fonticola]NTY86582.1 hypothetical protein [Serratia fonticola]NTZ12467.1 hypothetical protein [Serratia fonticola]